MRTDRARAEEKEKEKEGTKEVATGVREDPPIGQTPIIGQATPDGDTRNEPQLTAPCAVLTSAKITQLALVRIQIPSHQLALVGMRRLTLSRTVLTPISTWRRMLPATSSPWPDMSSAPLRML